jgi:hypothetical protein
MKVEGVLLALIDVPPEHTAEYNRWYDFDHLPEHASKPDVIVGRRYVAPADLRGLGHAMGDLTGGHPPYLTTYLLGAPDFADDAVATTWRAKDKTLAASGRFFRAGSVPFARRMRLARARACITVGDDAIPYLPHRGVVVAIGRAGARRDDAVRWWEDTRLPMLLDVDGVVAWLRFDPVATDDDLLVHLILLEDDPAAVMRRLDGRATNAPYESIAFLPYRRIVPLEYDFAW